MTTVDEILHRWPLRSMLARLNITVPERGKFRSPFRPDNSPSCEIWKETIRDRTSGESYDSIKCFAEAKGLTNAEAIRTLAAELPGRESKPAPAPAKSLTLPEVGYSQEQARAVANLRGLGNPGPEMAGAILGTLVFGKVGGFDCWILTDGAKRLAEARRMDGKPFPAIGSLGQRKSHTLKGSCKSWPLGIMSPKVTVPPGLPVVLVEGGPDYVSACELAFYAKREFLPVAMMGAGQNIHAEALPLFNGREVTILAHPDDAGLTAAKKWAGQLMQTGAKPKARQLEGGDLNDIVKLHGGKTVASLLDL